ncbi:MAG: PAS domain S-box protein, partial [Chloroflexota bacterium]
MKERTSILVVEDERIVAHDIRTTLQNSGYTVPATAGTGEEAITLAEQTGPDLVLMDIVLPGKLDGIQAAEEIRARLGIPIIYLTAYSDDPIIARARATEPIGYVMKPFEEKDLLTTIEISLHQYIVSRDRAEAQLHASEERFRHAFEYAPIGMALVTPDGLWLDVNNALCEMLGYSRQDLLHATLSQITHPDEFEKNTDLVRQLLAGEINRIQMEQRLIHNTGTMVWTNWSTSLVRDATGEPSYFVLQVENISARKQAGIALRESEARLREAERIALLGHWELDLLTNKLFWSDEIFKLFEMEPSTFGASFEAFLEAIHPDDRESVNQAYVDSVKCRTPYSIDHRIALKDGRIKFVHEHCETYYDAQGNAVRSIGTVQDITERKQAENALQSLNRALTMINQCNQAIVRSYDENLLLHEMCKLIVEVGGYRMAWVGYAEQDEKKSVRPVAQSGFEEGYLEQAQISWADHEHGRGPTGTAIREGTTQVNQDFLNDPRLAPWRESASQRGYQSSISLPLKAEAGVFGALNIYSSVPHAFNSEEVQLLEELANDLAYAINALRERVERKRAEETVRAERQRFYDVLETLPAHIVLLTPDYQVRFVNRFFRERFGESRGRRCYEYLFGRTQPCEVCETYIVLRTSQTHNWKWIGPDGRYYDVYDFPFTDTDGSSLILEMGIDITERKQAEEKLKSSEERFRAAFNGHLDAFFLLKGWRDETGQVTDFVFVDMNARAEEQFGIPREKLLGRRIGEALPINRTGGFFEKYLKVFETGQALEEEYSIPQGHAAPGWYYHQVIPLSDGVAITNQDITERKKAEERIRNQLARIESLRAIDVTIMSSTDLKLTLRVILDQVRARLGVDATDVMLFNPYVQQLEYTGGIGFRTRNIERAVIPLADDLARQFVIERKIMIVENIKIQQPIFAHARLLDGENFVFYCGVPLIIKGKVKGILEIFHRQRLQPDQDWFRFLDALAGQIAIAIENTQLFADLERTNFELVQAYNKTIEGWSAALDLRDKETEGHTQRVTNLTVELARNMGAPNSELLHIRRGALLHDIGKMGVPDHILLKPGSLSDEEWKIMREHPVFAHNLLAPI